MTDMPINLSASGPPETVLNPEPEPALAMLRDALLCPAAAERFALLAAILARWPGCLAAWAQLGECTNEDVVAYAAFRVGYHRGLDRLRQNGWRGSGYVRWEHPENQGFLHALDGLRRMSAKLGDDAEAQRCEEFLYQLDPQWNPANITQLTGG